MGDTFLYFLMCFLNFLCYSVLLNENKLAKENKFLGPWAIKRNEILTFVGTWMDGGEHHVKWNIERQMPFVLTHKWKLKKKKLTLWQ
jgi:hypothetical protein